MRLRVPEDAVGEFRREYGQDVEVGRVTPATFTTARILHQYRTEHQVAGLTPVHTERFDSTSRLPGMLVDCATGPRVFYPLPIAVQRAMRAARGL